MEENMEEIQAKQALLQTEIIEKNYDKTAFINFCLSKKENGDDLNNWSLDELKEIVNEFINTQTEVHIEAQPEPQSHNEPTQQEPQQQQDGQDIKKEDIEKMEKFNAEDSKNFKEKVLTCKKLEKTELSDKKLIVTVKNPKEKDGGVFGKNYVLYEVHTSLISIISENLFLNISLRSMFLHYQIRKLETDVSKKILLLKE